MIVRPVRSADLPALIDLARSTGAGLTTLLTTRDISESGVFVVIDDAQKLLQIGELVSGQVQGLPIEAPVVLMRVVRYEASVVALPCQN